MSPGRLPLAMLLFAVAAHADAQVARVFVSVTGNDANVCSNIVTPCRTLGGGIAQVDTYGEVIVIDSGSYAGGTITKSVKINVAAGIVAFSGLPITVDPGAAGTVVLRGLTLKAASAGSGAAITQASGTLFVENVVADGWYHGIYVSAGPVTRLFVKGSVIRNNTVGLEVQSGSPVKTTIDDSFFENNASVGLQLSSGIGRVSDTVVTASPTGVAVQNPGTVFTLQRCEVSGSGLDAVIVDAGGALAVSDSTLTDSETGLHNNGDGATLATFSNNVFRNNTFDIVGTYTPATLQ